MAITNLYPNLPGHLVEFKDGGLQFTVEPDTGNGITKSLLILGTAFDGPVMEPVKIDKTTVTQVFGSDVNDKGFSNGATLVKYAKQAFRNGFRDVRCMRVTGTNAFIDIKKAEDIIKVEKNGVKIDAISGNDSVSLSLGQKNIMSYSVKLNNGTPVVGTTVDNMEGDLNIPQNTVARNAAMECTFDYRVINPVTTTVSVGTAVADPIALPVTAGATLIDPAGADNAYYDTTVGTTKTAAILVSGPDGSGGTVPYTEGTEYNIVNGEIVLDPLTATNVVAGDTLNVEFQEYTLVTGSTVTVAVPQDAKMVLDHVVKAGTAITVEYNGAIVPDTKYTVADEVVGTETKTVITLTSPDFVMGNTMKVSYLYEEEKNLTEAVRFQAMFGGSLYNECKLEVQQYTNDEGENHCKFIFTKPASKLYSSGEQPFFITSEACPTVEQLQEALRNYEYNNVFEVICDDDSIKTNDFPAMAETALAGGDDGVVVNANQLYEALSGKRNPAGYLLEAGAYQILENYHVDYIYPAGVYADMEQTVNPNSGFHQELCLVCAVLTYRTKMTHGFIDVRPNSNTTLKGIQAYVDRLLAYDNYHYMKDADGNDFVDAEGNKMDLGWYTSLVVGPEPVMTSDTLGRYYGSPALAYAALNASIAPQSAPTNKVLPGCSGMKYKFSNKQMNELVGNRMVVFKIKGEGTTTASSKPYVVDGCTAGGPQCDYRRIATVKVVTDVVDQIREVSDPFLGEPNTIEQRNALSALISKRLGKCLEDGEIQYYEFEINATVEQVLLGECTISLTLVVPQELRKITTVVALRATA